MRIAFIATRLAGTDGVSLETHKLATIARRLGHAVFYCAGELDSHMPGRLLPKMHFRDPQAVALGERAFSGTAPDPQLEVDITARAAQLKISLRRFLQEEGIEYVVVQNAFAIPMQLPLAQALAEVLDELGLPGLAHNHDLYWERDRFLNNRIPHFLDTYFPPALPGLQHAVINSLAGRELKRRRGLESLLIPNVFDFDTPPAGIDDYNADFRQAIGLSDDDWLILQPTRVIARKGIELAIELVARLNDPRAKLVITHAAGDEGLGYLRYLQGLAADMGVDMRHVSGRIGETRGKTAGGEKIYALWDAYPHADLVTYPSVIEGFGNALLETIYFRKPLVVNAYIPYRSDIKPAGVHAIEIREEVTPATADAALALLDDPAAVEQMVEHNYRVALDHFSYRAVRPILSRLLDA